MTAYLYTGTDKPQLSAKQAGIELARLMERQLGYVEGHIDNVALRHFIRAYWSRVRLYAHAIHDDNEDGPAET
jgi:hypothetical protein